MYTPPPVLSHGTMTSCKCVCLQRLFFSRTYHNYSIENYKIKKENVKNLILQIIFLRFKVFECLSTKPGGKQHSKNHGAWFDSIYRVSDMFMLFCLGVSVEELDHKKRFD